MSDSAEPRLNPGAPLDLSRVMAVRVNQPAVVRRVAQLNGSRSVKKNYQAAWLVKTIQCMDLTTCQATTPRAACAACAPKPAAPCVLI